MGFVFAVREDDRSSRSSSRAKMSGVIPPLPVMPAGPAEGQLYFFIYLCNVAVYYCCEWMAVIIAFVVEQHRHTDVMTQEERVSTSWCGVRAWQLLLKRPLS